MAGKKKLVLEDYKAPWETDSDGNDLPEEEQVIDADRLKKYLFGLLSDKEQAVEARDTAQRELSTAQEQLAEKARKDESDDERRQREADERAEREQKARQADLKLTKLTVALDQDGITKEAARELADLLQGDTEDELDAHAKRLIEKFGLAKAAGKDDEDDDEDDDAPSPRTRPRTRRNPGDPEPHRGAELPLEKQLELIPRPISY